jgi:hypothetical protein
MWTQRVFISAPHGGLIPAVGHAWWKRQSAEEGGVWSLKCFLDILVIFHSSCYFTVHLLLLKYFVVIRINIINQYVQVAWFWIIHNIFSITNGNAVHMGCKLCTLFKKHILHWSCLPIFSEEFQCYTYIQCESEKFTTAFNSAKIFWRAALVSRQRLLNIIMRNVQNLCSSRTIVIIPDGI